MVSIKVEVVAPFTFTNNAGRVKPTSPLTVSTYKNVRFVYSKISTTGSIDGIAISLHADVLKIQGQHRQLAWLLSENRRPFNLVNFYS